RPGGRAIAPWGLVRPPGRRAKRQGKAQPAHGERSSGDSPRIERAQPAAASNAPQPTVRPTHQRMNGKVGSFCCPVLPEPLESPSVARWGPTALKLYNVRPLGPQLRGKSERLVIVGTCVNEPSRWLNPIGNRDFIALVDPVSPPSATLVCSRGWWWRRRGTAPRVRNAYSTRYSTDIASF